MKKLIPWRWGQKNAMPARTTDWFEGWREEPFGNLIPLLHNSLSSPLPSVDVSEGKSEVRVKAEIPGMSEKEIDLTWSDGVLTIRGEKKDEKEENNSNSYYRECSYGSFCRSINVGNNVDWSKAKAKCKNGILTVSFPKIETAKKAIEIKVN